MSVTSRFLCLITVTVLAAGPVAADDAESDIDRARALIKSFSQSLQGRLSDAIAESGPVHAVSVCHTDAPRIAAEQEAASGWQVARTSLKVRNPDNEPDAWEQQVLKSFAERMAAGEDPAGIDRVEVVEQDGREILRYMKAIPTGQICVTCHGEDLESDLAQRIDELYPHDQARGFEVGELRGAFTLSKPLER